MTVTFVNPPAQSYLEARDKGTIAETAAACKSTEHVALDSRYIFQPTVVKSLSPINTSAITFLGVLG